MNHSIFDLFLSAGLIGKTVILALVAVSIFCWSVIFTKRKQYKIALQKNKEFIDFFWKSLQMDEIFNRVDHYHQSPVAQVFKAGMKEIKRDQQDYDTLQERLHRTLQKTANDEIAVLEKNVSWLATTASSAPFVGLFGTVWGIMTSFQNIGASGSANLAVVAPGISEALIATAMGIAAAIPAAIFYNHFVSQLKRMSLDVDGFIQDFLNIQQRKLKS
jgi:biopolymer transport protein TolQ